MDRQIARGYATSAICAIIGTDGTLYTMDYRCNRKAVARFTKGGQSINPLACDTTTQARAILRAHKYLGITMPVLFESEFAEV